MPTPTAPPPPPNGLTEWRIIPTPTFCRPEYLDPFAEIEVLLRRDDLTGADIKYFCNAMPILQQGPQCGLVALAMATHEYPKKITVEEIFTEAKRCGFSQLGELYSVDSMCKLTAKFMPDHRPEILTDLKNHPESIITTLMSGAKVLIPYDADLNHSPTLRNGHRAHWALLVGLISCNQGYYVLARQGKSIRLALWPLVDLIESNDNLQNEGPVRHTGGYLIPEGGVGGERGLKGRAIALHPCNNPVTSL